MTDSLSKFCCAVVRNVEFIFIIVKINTQWKFQISLISVSNVLTEFFRKLEKSMKSTKPKFD